MAYISEIWASDTALIVGMARRATQMAPKNQLGYSESIQFEITCPHWWDTFHQIQNCCWARVLVSGSCNIYDLRSKTVHGLFILFTTFCIIMQPSSGIFLCEVCTIYELPLAKISEKDLVLSLYLFPTSLRRFYVLIGWNIYLTSAMTCIPFFIHVKQSFS